MDESQQETRSKRTPREPRDTVAPPSSREHDGVTVFWYSQEAPDFEMAQEYIQKLVDGGMNAARVMHAAGVLRLDQVTDSTRVIVLKRRSERDRSEREFADGGRRTIVRHTHLAPIEECEPVFGTEAWRYNIEGNPQFGGVIDHGQFLRGLGPKISPMCVRYRPEQTPGIASLHYA